MDILDNHYISGTNGVNLINDSLEHIAFIFGFVVSALFVYVYIQICVRPPTWLCMTELMIG